MATRKNTKVPTFPVRKGESLKSIYARLKKGFTAADLQEYTEVEDNPIPFEHVLAELKAIQDEPTKRPAPTARKRSHNGRAK